MSTELLSKVVTLDGKLRYLFLLDMNCSHKRRAYWNECKSYIKLQRLVIILLDLIGD